MPPPPQATQPARTKGEKRKEAENPHHNAEKLSAELENEGWKLDDMEQIRSTKVHTVEGARGRKVESK